MTADIQRQIALAKGQKPPSVPSAPSPKGETQPGAVGERKSKEIEEDTTPAPNVAATHYIGRYQLNVANGTHYPGRARVVIVGPASEALTAALVAALTQFVKP